MVSKGPEARTEGTTTIQTRDDSPVVPMQVQLENQRRSDFTREEAGALNQFLNTARENPALTSEQLLKNAADGVTKSLQLLAKSMGTTPEAIIRSIREEDTLPLNGIEELTNSNPLRRNRQQGTSEATAMGNGGQNNSRSGDGTTRTTGATDNTGTEGSAEGRNAIRAALATAMGRNGTRELNALGNDRNVRDQSKLNSGRDIDPSRDNQQEVLRNFRNFAGGDNAAQLQEFLRTTEANLRRPEVARHLQGTPEQEMQRIYRSINESMEVARRNPEKRQDAINTMMDQAARAADPKTYGNQGDHLTCDLQSLRNTQKPRVADQFEQMASVINRGGAFVGEGNDRRWVQLNQASLGIDRESAIPWNAQDHGVGGMRGRAGHYSDALYGQLNADLMTSRYRRAGILDGDERIEYCAANLSDAGVGHTAGQGRTNEGMIIVDGQGKPVSLFSARMNEGVTDPAKRIGAEGPQVGLREAAELGRAVNGRNYSFFVSEDLYRRSGGDVRLGDLRSSGAIRTFNANPGSTDLQTQLTDYANRTGLDGQIGVNANQLRGGTADSRHALHAMSISLAGATINSDGTIVQGTGRVQIDNQWGERADRMAHAMDLNEINKAADPTQWKNPPQDMTNDKFDPEHSKDSRKDIENADKKQEEEKQNREKQQKQLEKQMQYQKLRTEYEQRKEIHDSKQRELLQRDPKYSVIPFDEKPPTLE